MKLCPICQRCYEDDETACAQDGTALVVSRPGSCVIAGKYRYDRLLGRGGMGAVYSGTHLDLERPVAIKLLLPDLTADADALERFRREARAAASINHPNVADTYDYGQLPDGGAYIVMEMVEGQTLREYMDAAGPLPLNESLSIAAQIAEGMEVAHRRGIVHRDLKPSNVILSSDYDGQPQAKIVDFGVAKLKEHSTTGGLTASNSMIGTPRYMSPEQCAGHPADARSDIYSVGIMLFEMLTARAPFDAPSPTAIAVKHIQEPPPSPREFRPELPEELDRLILRVLDKNPSARPQTAAELARALGAIRQQHDGSQQKDAPARVASVLAATRPSNAPHPATNRSNGEHGPTGRSGTPTIEHAVTSAHTPAPPSVQGYAQTGTVAAPGPTSGPAAAGEETREARPREVKSPAAHAARSGPHDAMPAAPAVDEPRRRPSTFAFALMGAALFALAFGAVAFWLSQRDSPPQTSGEISEATKAEAINNRNVPAAPSPAAGNRPAVNENGDPSARNANQTPGVRAAQAELRTSLDGWVAATNANDLNKQMKYYAPVLDRFYQWRATTRDAARNEKQKFMAGVNTINVSVSEPQTTVSDDGRTATMVFRKSYTFGGARPASGEVLQELRWTNTPAGWQITSERDVQIIR